MVNHVKPKNSDAIIKPTDMVWRSFVEVDEVDGNSGGWFPNLLILIHCPWFSL
jgi:hypothetical protein